MYEFINSLDQLKTLKIDEYNKVLKKLRDIQNERFSESVVDSVYYTGEKPQDHPDYNIKKVNFFKE